VKKFLHTQSDVPAKLTAPPSGLFLERVYYKGDVWLKEMRPAIDISSFRKNRSERIIGKGSKKVSVDTGRDGDE